MDSCNFLLTLPSFLSVKDNLLALQNPVIQLREQHHSQFVIVAFLEESVELNFGVIFDLSLLLVEMVEEAHDLRELEQRIEYLNAASDHAVIQLHF
jgi:hypothetical protein